MKQLGWLSLACVLTAFATAQDDPNRNSGSRATIKVGPAPRKQDDSVQNRNSGSSVIVPISPQKLNPAPRGGQVQISGGSQSGTPSPSPAPGPQGQKGDKGDDGDRGDPGTNGTNGTNGKDGKSLTREELLVLIREVFKEQEAALKGKDGQDGEDGVSPTIDEVLAKLPSIRVESYNQVVDQNGRPIGNPVKTDEETYPAPWKIKIRHLIPQVR